MVRLVPLLALFACAAKTEAVEEATSDPSRVISRSVDSEGLITQQVDFDGDGKAEVTNYFRDRSEAADLIVRKDLDLNRDARVDVVSYFDESGELQREEMDSDFDGRFDAADHYQGGVRVLSEYDTDFDGRPNVFKYYTANEQGRPVLNRKERDTDGDGKIDVWERFAPTGEVIRTARDTDGDGKMDVRED